MAKFPEFIGGEIQFAKYLSNRIDTINWTHYFEDALLSTKIVIRFIVNKDGTISDVYV